MIMVLGIGLPARLERARTVEIAELRVNEREQVIPAEERLVVGVAVRSTIASNRRRSRGSTSLEKMVGV